MSQENVDLVRRGWALFMESVDQGDPAAGLRALFDRGIYSSTCVLTTTPETTGAEKYIGPEGQVEWLRLWTEDFQAWRIWPEEIIEAGDNRVVVVARQTARGKGSGATVGLQFGVVYTVETAQIVDIRHYIDPADALEAAGLLE